MSNLTRYRSEPQEVLAVQYVGQPLPGIVFENEEHTPYVVTIQRQCVYIRPGEYVIQEPDGEHYYPCAKSIFEKKYHRFENSGFALEEIITEAADEAVRIALLMAEAYGAQGWGAAKEVWKRENGLL